MYGRKSSRVLGALLFLLSLAYGAVVRLRSRAYAGRFFTTKRLPCRVISIGNITLGGTGKTPTVVNMASLLLRQGKRPLVLSRGYGRADEAEIAVVSDGVATVLDPSAAGDEPFLIASRLPTVSVVVGRDRYAAGVFALERFHPDTIILDDGFQHLRLGRDLDIVLIDGADPFGRGLLFPAGILREPLSALRRADVIIITKVDQAADLPSLKETIRSHSAAWIFTARYAPRDLVDVATGATRSLTSLRGTRVFAFAGIARPGSFASVLTSLGADVKGMVDFPDHHPYTRTELAGLIRKAADSQATMVVTTEKDGVRLRGMVSEGVWTLRIDLEVVEKSSWEEILSG